MEVSMPTGSLCAERNVIGTALSANPKLKREDLKMIAVLAVPYAPTMPDSITGGGAAMKRINSTASFTSATRKISIGSEQEEWVASSPSLPPTTALLLPPKSLLSSQRQSREDLASSFAMVGLNDDVIVDASGDRAQSAAATVEASNRQQQQQQHQHQHQHQQQDNSLPNTPIRKISLFSKNASLPDLMPTGSDPNSNIDNKGSKKKPSSTFQRHDSHEQQRPHHQQQRGVERHNKQYDKRTVVVHSSTDMNPLAPCGACNEWLKKIAESNPYFRIVTFTDADCNGVYCANCQE
jgi:cytidine deaminase